MSPVAPRMRIPVGVVVERRKANSPWAEVIWRPVGVLSGLPNAKPWTTLSTNGEVALFYVGAAEIELHRSEAGNYRSNIVSGAPSIWVALHPTGGEPSYKLAAVTVDPAEGEALTEPGTAIVEAVPMPEPVRDVVAAFVAAHYVEHPFEKRVRDRADPEALARHGPRHKDTDE
jgi:hypothetical protein